MSRIDTGEPVSARTVADTDGAPGTGGSRPSNIGRYVILDAIGMGGMGLVCAAYDPNLDRKVALKLLRTASTDEASQAGRQRLFREAQALAKLSHPNVVTVHDVDVFEDQVYIAMEFVEGTNLRDWIRAEVRPWPEILDRFIRAGRGVAAAHAAGIIHRDFKPANVLLSKEGDVRVADFGVAKSRGQGDWSREVGEVWASLEDSGEASSFSESESGATGTQPGPGSGQDSGKDRLMALIASGIPARAALIEELQSNAGLELTKVGRMVGTPAYMAPEQHMGERVGPFTDQFSFCVSLYEALYGRMPYKASNQEELLAKMRVGKLLPPPKEGVGRNVPSHIHKVLERGLNPNPGHRWPSMNALLAALARDPAKRRRRWIMGAAGVCAIAGGLGLAFWSGEDLGASERDLCEGVGMVIHEHWNEDRKAALAASFARSGKPFADDAARGVSETLDRWTDSWQEQRGRICRATHIEGDQSERLMDLRIRCLDERKRDVVALLELLEEADAEMVERSVGAAYSLRDPAGCSTILPADRNRYDELDPETSRLVADLEADLARAEALALLSKFDESLPIRARVVAEARAVDHRPTIMRALHDLAQSQTETRDKAGAEASLREALALAAELDDPEQEARTWARLLHHVGYRQDRATEGVAWALAAEGALIRAGDLPELRLRYESAYGAILHRAGNYGEAVKHYAAGHEIAAEELGPNDPLTLNLLVNLGIGRATQGRNREACTLISTAAERFEVVYGPSHPRSANVYYNLGNVCRVSDRGKAEAALRTALRIREGVFGPEAPEVANVLQALGNLTLSKDPAGALVNFDRAAAIFVASDSVKSNGLAVTMTNIGRAQTQLGRYEEARASYDEAWRVYDLLYPEAHSRRVSLHNWRCDLFVTAELWPEAITACKLGLAEADRLDKRSPAERGLLEKLVQAGDAAGRLPGGEAYRQRLAALSAKKDPGD